MFSRKKKEKQELAKDSKKKPSKKQLKQEKKRAKKIKTTLDWMDIQSISADGILLQRGTKERITKGIKLEPINIFLEEKNDRMRRCRALSNAYDKLKFPLYLQFVRTVPNMDKYLDHYQNLAANEENSSIKKLTQIQLDKLDWFSDTFREVIFYVMIQSDEETLDKKFNMLFNEFSNAGFHVEEMTVSDYETVVSTEFENDTVNEYMFTQFLPPDDLDADYESEVNGNENS